MHVDVSVDSRGLAEYLRQTICLSASALTRQQDFGLSISLSERYNPDAKLLLRTGNIDAYSANSAKLEGPWNGWRRSMDEIDRAKMNNHKPVINIILIVCAIRP